MFNKQKNILVLEIDYKFIEQKKLKEYNFIYKNSFDKKVATNFDMIIVTNQLKKEDIKTSRKVITINEFLESKLQKLYLDDEIKIKSYSKFEYLVKRVVDFSVAIPLIILTLPIMLHSIYRIKKESPDGPIIFKQKRVGKDGKEFVCYKFRSMRTDINYFNPYTQDNDPRIFKWGEFMRKSRVDELPQLFNVLKGQMHIIGPRAEWVELVKEYEKQIPNYHLRHVVAPGITGWAQVNYPYGRNLEDTKQKLMYDLYYIKNWSFGLELKTIFKTIAVVIGRRGV